jgi:hypothetical protein
VKRRAFIRLVGGAAAAWPLTAGAQQLNVPLVGFLHLGSPQARTQRLAAFRQGLADNGYVAGPRSNTSACLDWRPISCSGKWR